MCTWSTQGIHKSCFFLMSTSGSGLGTLTNPIEPRHISHGTTFFKHGSFILEGFSGIKRFSICLDFMICMERKKQQSF